jgi:hypothetical protein
MSGPAPKAPGERRRYNQPARGEWVDLEPLQEPVLPEYDPEWSGWTTVRTREGDEYEIRSGVSPQMWEAWRSSPVTSQYGPEDVAACCYLGERFHSLPDSSRLALMDKLGLTPKGKRDLRWRTPAEVRTIDKQAQTPARARKLRAV